MKNTITFMAQVGKIETMEDNTLKVVLRTQELPPSQMAQAFSLMKLPCAVCIAPEGEKPDPLPPVTADAPMGKTPSQRLRGVLYRLWQQGGDGYEADRFYEIEMEKIINSIKAQLNS